MRHDVSIGDRMLVVILLSTGLRSCVLSYCRIVFVPFSRALVGLHFVIEVRREMQKGRIVQLLRI